MGKKESKWAGMKVDQNIGNPTQLRGVFNKTSVIEGKNPSTWNEQVLCSKLKMLRKHRVII